MNRDYSAAIVEIGPSAADTVARRAVRAVLAGDKDAFRILVDRESSTVYRICFRVLGCADDAQEAAQEAFLCAFRSLPTWRDDGPFGAWIARIALNTALRRSRRTRKLAWIDPLDTATIDDECSDDPAAGRVRRATNDAAVAAAPATDPALVAVHSEEGETCVLPSPPSRNLTVRSWHSGSSRS